MEELEIGGGSSFWFDAGFLDDRPPLLNLGLLQSAQRFRRLLLAGENLLSEFSKSRSARAATAASLILLMISLGVPRGAQRPCQ